MSQDGRKARFSLEFPRDPEKGGLHTREGMLEEEGMRINQKLAHVRFLKVPRGSGERAKRKAEKDGGALGRNSSAAARRRPCNEWQSHARAT